MQKIILMTKHNSFPSKNIYILMDTGDVLSDYEIFNFLVSEGHVVDVYPNGERIIKSHPLNYTRMNDYDLQLEILNTFAHNPDSNNLVFNLKDLLKLNYNGNLIATQLFLDESAFIETYSPHFDEQLNHLRTLTNQNLITYKYNKPIRLNQFPLTDREFYRELFVIFKDARYLAGLMDGGVSDLIYLVEFYRRFPEGLIHIEHLTIMNYYLKPHVGAPTSKSLSHISKVTKYYEELTQKVVMQANSEYSKYIM